MNKIPIFSLTLLFALILPLFANAQVTVKGIVTDESGVPLVGVSVRYKEVPQVGVTTDIDGKFSIKEVNEGKTLVFSYIGMKNAERLLKGQPLSSKYRWRQKQVNSIRLLSLVILKLHLKR